MRKLKLPAVLLLLLSLSFAQAQSVQDDFEGNGTITTWFGDDCGINTNVSNPYPQDINNSATVLSYTDTGGQYANIRFDIAGNFDLVSDNIFTIKIYVPSSSISGNQPNQVSLKLQDNNLDEPWSTQSEIIKPIVRDEWQTVSFDFANDNFKNLDPSSPPPTQRNDFNRVVIQINGENNNDEVAAYIDDVLYGGTIEIDETYDFLVWSDEFDGQGAIDPSKWHHQTQLPSGGSWYNGEIQHYTDREENSFVSDGTLKILGKKESFTDQGQTKQYTSARLNSKFAFTYGRVEVHAKLPTGVGTWPAIWTLGKNINEDGGYWDLNGFGTTPWPACGEIDIMEHWGANQDYVSSATHTPSSFGGTINIGGQTIEGVSDDFHTYTLDWYPDRLIFTVDGDQHYTYKPDVYNSNTWPFTMDQYLLLNFAFLPSIDPNFTEDALEIDYIRVYQSDPSSSVYTPDHNQLHRLDIVPNPAQNYITASYSLEKGTHVTLVIHDINGQQIKTLISEYQETGDHSIEWEVIDIPSGVYLCILKTENGSATKKILINR
jgi:beta-glucanase (GH16 family)